MSGSARRIASGACVWAAGPRPLALSLGFVERPRVAQADDPVALRAGFERRARFWFRAPRGSRFERDMIGGRAAIWAPGPGVARDRGPVLLYFHGGGYVAGCSDSGVDDDRIVGIVFLEILQANAEGIGVENPLSASDRAAGRHD